MTHEETTALVRRANASGFDTVAEYAAFLEAALQAIATRIPPSERNAEAEWRWAFAYFALRGRNVPERYSMMKLPGEAA